MALPRGVGQHVSGLSTVEPLVHRRTTLVLACVILIVAGLFVAGKRRPSVSTEETIETTLAEIARGDVHRVGAVRRELLRDSRFANHSRLLDAAAMLATGRPTEALGRALPFPDDPTLRWRFQLLAGKALHALGRFAEAEPLLQEVAQIHPHEPDALRWLGMVYYDLGAMDHAIGPLTELADLRHDDYRPHWLLGVIYHDFEKYVLAIQHFRAALDRAPPPDIELEIRGELARSLVADRAYQEALDLLLPNPQTALQMQLVAKCYFNLGELASARTWTDQAAALDSTDSNLALLQAELLKEQDSLAEAVRILQQATERHPHHPALRYQFSLSLRAHGQVAEADEQLRLWNAVNDRRKRLVELNEQAIVKPYDRAIREELAMLCRAIDEPQLAEMWQRAAESLRSRSPTGQ